MERTDHVTTPFHPPPCQDHVFPTSRKLKDLEGGGCFGTNMSGLDVVLGVGTWDRAGCPVPATGAFLTCSSLHNKVLLALSLCLAFHHRPKLLHPDNLTFLCLPHLLCLQVDLQLCLGQLTLQYLCQFLLEPPVPLHHPSDLLINKALRLLLELTIMLLPSPCLHLCPHSMGQIRNKMSCPQNP